jgi:lysophospholipase
MGYAAFLKTVTRPMTDDCITPDLEPRFLPPEGWRWHQFEHEGHAYRFGTVAPKSRRPDAIVIGLQGLSEFTEKYFEVAHNCLDRNLGFWMMDWRGQGQSDRYLTDREKRHAQDFDQDVEDLHYFLTEYVKHSAVHPDVGRIPMVMLAHSMGANIGLRYLEKYPDRFAFAAMTAPMAGIHRLGFLPIGLQTDLTRIAREIFDTSYIPGAKGWRPLAEKDDSALLTTDPVRGRVADSWARLNPALRVGGITCGWLYHAVRSCALLWSKGFLASIKTPILIALASDENIVDNRAIRRLAAGLPDCRLLECQPARHEILMEKDEIRGKFFQAFDELLAKTNLKARITPF